MANFAEALRVDSDLLDRLGAGAPRLIAGLLIALIAVQAALFVADLAGAPATTAATAGASPLQTRTVVDLPSILRANLFGQAAAPTGKRPRKDVVSATFWPGFFPYSFQPLVWLIILPRLCRNWPTRW